MEHMADSKYIKADSASEEAANYLKAFGLLAVVVFIFLKIREANQSNGNDDSGEAHDPPQYRIGRIRGR